MKKIANVLCFLGLIGFSGASFAEHPWDTHWPENIWLQRWQTNYVLGLFAGYADREGPFRANVSYGVFPAQAEITRDISNTGIIYGLLAGYQGKCRNWLFGGEFSLERHPISSSNAFAFSDAGGLFGWQGVTEYHRDWMAGFTFRGGYYFVDYFLPYVRIGVETGQDSLDTTLSTNGLNVAPIYLQNKTWIWRFLSGVGIEAPIYCTALTMRAEYQFHSKGKTIETDNLYTDGIINPVVNARMQPKTQTWIFALVANFD